jgi:hypothetical protein
MNMFAPDLLRNFLLGFGAASLVLAIDMLPNLL